MELAPAGVSLSFEVTYDSPSLYVAMSVYDDSGVSPVLISGPSAMLNWAGNSYRGKFTANPGISYLILKAVYTDGTFTTLSSNYSQGSESIKSEYLQDTIGNCSIIGFINNTEIIGLVNC